MKSCLVDGCARRYNGKGYCAIAYILFSQTQDC